MCKVLTAVVDEDYTPRGLKQHRFISPQFHRWKVVSRAQLVSLSRPEKGQIQVLAGWPLPANFWEQSSSSPLQVGGRILFLVVVGLRSHSLAGCRFGVSFSPGGLSLALAHNQQWCVNTISCLEPVGLLPFFCFSPQEGRLLSRTQRL